MKHPPTLAPLAAPHGGSQLVAVAVSDWLLFVRVVIAAAALAFGMVHTGTAAGADLARGAQVYNSFCNVCHGEGANPGPEPIKLGAGEPYSLTIAFRTVIEMEPFGFDTLLTETDVADLAAYLAVKFDIVPPPPPPQEVTAVEYYHAAFDHFFVTTGAEEITKLDNGTFAGWARTGKQFKALSTAAMGLSSVCRFFSTTFAKSSHFYTPDAGECGAVKANPNWEFEAEVFYAVPPAQDGSCPGGTAPVYRVYNNGQSGAPNHRYTTDLAVRSEMLEKGWIAEGYGQIGVIMCAPP